MPPRTQSRDPRTDIGAFLGRTLRDIRVEGGYRTQDVFAPALGADRSVVGKAETGEYPPTEPILAKWLDLCGVDGMLRATVEGLNRFARMRDGGPVKAWFLGWFDAEAKAHTLRIWQPIIFPGLIQTPAYARAIFATTGLGDDQIEELVQARLDRQKILGRPDLPTIVIVLDELVLHRLIGTAELMREQIAHAIELSTRPNIHFHILPSRNGANLGLGGPIHLATSTGNPDVLLEGALIEDQVTLEPPLIRKASATLEAVRSDALNRSDSRNAMTEALERWND